MAGKNERLSAELYESFFGPLQSALSCFTQRPLQGEYPFASDRSFTLRLGGEGPARLGRTAAFSFQLIHSYQFGRREDELEIQTTRYAYWLLDRDDRELLLYQWDPGEGSKVTTPHLHVRALGMLTAANLPDRLETELVRRLVRAHLPTGHVTLAEVLRMAVDDLIDEPLETDEIKLGQRLTAADIVPRAALAWQVAA